MVKKYVKKEVKTKKVLKLYSYCKICGKKVSNNYSNPCLLLGTIHWSCCHKENCDECWRLIDLHDARQIYNVIKKYFYDIGSCEIFINDDNLEQISELLEINKKTIEKIILIFIEHGVITRDVYKTRYYFSQKKILPRE